MSELYFYHDFKDMEFCQRCGYSWPEQCVQPMFESGTYTPTCAFCAEAIMGGLHGEMASFILEVQEEYFMSRRGRRNFLAQRFNRIIKHQTQKGITIMITPVVRFSYANVFEPRKTPSGDMKYSVACLLPKEDTKGVAEINKAIQDAVKDGVTKNTFSQAHVKALRLPLRDGDTEVDNDGNPKYKGFYFFNANSSNQPGVIDAQLKPLMTKDEFYSGCWGRADVNFFPYNQAGNRGVGVGLNNVMKVKDDDRLDGRQSAEDAFSKYAETTTEEANEGDDSPFV